MSDSDDATPTKGGTPVKVGEKRRRSDDDDDTDIEDEDSTPPPLKKRSTDADDAIKIDDKRPKCRYWEKCFRRDANHRKTFQHPSETIATKSI